MTGGPTTCDRRAAASYRLGRTTTVDRQRRYIGWSGPGGGPGGALRIAELAASARRHQLGWGRIVSLTRGGPMGFPGEVSYGAAKAAR
jgi:NAD(P)-dependent dehydrogenase (short-subunit alcohol dehydrogenase family)